MKAINLRIMSVFAFADIAGVLTFAGEVPGKSALNGSNPAITAYTALLEICFVEE